MLYVARYHSYHHTSVRWRLDRSSNERKIHGVSVVSSGALALMTKKLSRGRQAGRQASKRRVYMRLFEPVFLKSPPITNTSTHTRRRRRQPTPVCLSVSICRLNSPLPHTRTHAHIHLYLPPPSLCNTINRYHPQYLTLVSPIDASL